MANWKFSQEGWLIAQEIQAGGGSEPKNSSLGITFNFNNSLIYSTAQKKPNREQECEQVQNGYRTDIERIRNSDGTQKL